MKKLFTLSLCVLFSIAAQSQTEVEQRYSFHVGLFGGLSIYDGDLVDKPLEQIAETHPSFGAYLRFKYGKNFSARLAATYGRVSGDDRNSSTDWRTKRNLRFRSPVVEVALIPEFDIYDIVLSKSGYVITPFVYAGVGGFWFNPQTQYNGEWVDLQPLGTEGQGIPGNDDLYSRVAVSIPAGIGLKFKLSDYTTFTWETGLRITNTDYLDDVHHLYPDFDALREARGSLGELAVALSDRTTENVPQIPTSIQPGDTRSNGKINDSFLFTGFSVSVNLSPKAKQ
jgi:hypothetical protein